MNTVVIDYTNWRGERRERKIAPKHLIFGSTEYHPHQQWLLVATDVEKGEERTFAMSSIHSWSGEADLIRNNDKASLLKMLDGENVFSITKDDDGEFCIKEGCDDWYRVHLSREQLLALSEEIRVLANS